MYVLKQKTKSIKNDTRNRLKSKLNTFLIQDSL